MIYHTVLRAFVDEREHLDPKKMKDLKDSLIALAESHGARVMIKSDFMGFVIVQFEANDLIWELLEMVKRLNGSIRVYDDLDSSTNADGGTL